MGISYFVDCNPAVDFPPGRITWMQPTALLALLQQDASLSVAEIGSRGRAVVDAVLETQSKGFEAMGSSSGAWRWSIRTSRRPRRHSLRVDQTGEPFAELARPLCGNRGRHGRSGWSSTEWRGTSTTCCAWVVTDIQGYTLFYSG